MLTTLSGDTPWLLKLLKAAGCNATNGCHECHVPTMPLSDPGDTQTRQRYGCYKDGIVITEAMAKVINATKTEVTMPTI